MTVTHTQTQAEAESHAPGTERVLLMRQIMPANRDTDVIRLYVDPDPAALDQARDALVTALRDAGEDPGV